MYCRDIFLDDLVLSGMLEADVRRIISALDAGIFKTDYDAYMVARAQSAVLIEDPGADAIVGASKSATASASASGSGGGGADASARASGGGGAGGGGSAGGGAGGGGGGGAM